MEPRLQGPGKTDYAELVAAVHSPEVAQAAGRFAQLLAVDDGADRAFGFVGELKIIEGRVAYMQGGITRNGGIVGEDGRLKYSPSRDPFGIMAAIHQSQLDADRIAYSQARALVERALKNDPETEAQYRSVEEGIDRILSLSPDIKNRTGIIRMINTWKGLLKGNF